MQFTTTTVDRSHTKCDFNPCASRGVGAGHHPECPFDKEDLDYQQERDNQTNYQPPMVELSTEDPPMIDQQSITINTPPTKAQSPATLIIDDSDYDDCETLSSASMDLDSASDTESECSGCTGCTPSSSSLSPTEPQPTIST